MLERFLSSMDPGGGFGGAFGGGKAGGAQDPMTFVKRPTVIARICALVRDIECRVCRFSGLWLGAFMADTLFRGIKWHLSRTKSWSGHSSSSHVTDDDER